MSKVVSIEVGYSLTRICEVDYKVKNPKVYTAFTIPTPVDVLEDGLIRQPEALAEAIKAGLHEHGVKTKQTVYSINSTKIANREVMLPYVKENRIEALLEVNVGDYFPVDISKYKLTYNVLDTVTAEDGKKQYKLMVLAAPKDMLESYYTLSSQCGLSVTALDHAGNSIVSMTKHAFPEDTHMVIKVDERSTLLTVYSSGNMVLQRTVPYGADPAAETIMESEEGKDVSYNVAVELLRKKPCVRKSLDPDVEDDNDEDDEEVRNFRLSVSESLSMLCNGVLRVIDYYNSRNANEPIKDIFLTGYAENFIGLKDFMANETGTPVEALSDAPGLSFGTDERNKGEFVSCIGSVIEPLDLIPDEHNDKKKKKVKVVKEGETGTDTGGGEYIKIGVLVLVGCIVIAGVLAALACFGYMGAADQNKALRTREAELAPVELIYADYTSMQTLSEDVKAMYQSTQTHNDEIVAFIEELEAKLPSRVNVLAFTASNESVAMTITLDSKEAAALTMQELRNFETIEDIVVSSVAETTDELGVSTVNFSIQAIYAPMMFGGDAEQTEGEVQ